MYFTTWAAFSQTTSDSLSPNGQRDRPDFLTLVLCCSLLCITSCILFIAGSLAGGRKGVKQSSWQRVLYFPHYYCRDHLEGHTSPLIPAPSRPPVPTGSHPSADMARLAEAADLLKWTAVQFYCLLGKESDFAGNTNLPSSFGNRGYKCISGHTFWQKVSLLSTRPSSPHRSLMDHILSPFLPVSHQQTHTTLPPFSAGDSDFPSVQIFTGLSVKWGCENQRRESKLSWSAVIKNKWGKTVSWRTDENQLSPGRWLASLVFTTGQGATLELHPPRCTGMTGSQVPTGWSSSQWLWIGSKDSKGTWTLSRAKWPHRALQVIFQNLFYRHMVDLFYGSTVVL